MNPKYSDTKRMLWWICAGLLAYAVPWFTAVYMCDAPLDLIAPLWAVKADGGLTGDMLTSVLIGGGIALLGLLFNPYRQRKVHGNARFATESDIRKMNVMTDKCDVLDDDGIILGGVGGMRLKYQWGLGKNRRTIRKRIGGRYLRCAKPLSVLILAPPGTGKTVNFIIPGHFSCTDRSVVSLDPKGEIYETTRGFRSQFSRIVKFEPGADLSADSAIWNPLASEELPQNWGDIEDHVNRVAVGFLPDAGDNADAAGHNQWIEGARQVFVTWALYLTWKNGLDTGSSGTALGEIITKALNGTPHEALEDLRHELEGYPECPQRIVQDVAYLQGLSEKSPRQFDGYFGLFKSKLQTFQNERIQRATGYDPATKELLAPTFRFRDLRTSKHSVYLVLKPHEIDRLKNLLAFFFEYGILSLAESYNKEKDNQVTFFLDEFPRLGKMSQVLQMPDIGRGLGINCVFVAQDFGQIEDIYKKRAETLYSTCAFQIIYAQNKFQHAKLVSDTIGTFTHRKVSKSDRQKSVFKSHGESEEAIALVLPQDIQNMEIDQSLVLVQRHLKHPIRTWNPYWALDKEMKRRAALPVLGMTQAARAEHMSVVDTTTPAAPAGNNPSGNSGQEMYQDDQPLIEEPEEIGNEFDDDLFEDYRPAPPSDEYFGEDWE